MPKIYEEQCRLFIEQEIEEFINDGNNERSITEKAQEIVNWVQDKFNRSINKETVRRDIYREKSVQNAQLPISDCNNTETQINQVEHGGNREGAGRPLKFLIGDDKEITKVANQIKKEKQVQKRIEREQEEKELKQEYVEDDSVKIIQGDFRESCQSIDDGSIDCVLTDLPYPREYLSLWNDLSRISARVLKPNGFLITYSGQYHLPYVINALSEHLEYFWTFALYHKGRSQIVNNRNLMCKWKPILIFRNGTDSRFESTIPDYVVSEQPEKDDHEWQQGESAIAQLIEYFTKPNELILDVCAGSGTTGVVAKRLKRRSILIEIEKESIDKIERRLSGE